MEINGYSRATFMPTPTTAGPRIQNKVAVHKRLRRGTPSGPSPGPASFGILNASKTGIRTTIAGPSSGPGDSLFLFDRSEVKAGRRRPIRGDEARRASPLQHQKHQKR